MDPYKDRVGYNMVGPYKEQVSYNRRLRNGIIVCLNSRVQGHRTDLEPCAFLPNKDGQAPVPRVRRVFPILSLLRSAPKPLILFWKSAGDDSNNSGGPDAFRDPKSPSGPSWPTTTVGFLENPAPVS